MASSQTRSSASANAFTQMSPVDSATPQRRRRRNAPQPKPPAPEPVKDPRTGRFVKPSMTSNAKQLTSSPPIRSEAVTSHSTAHPPTATTSNLADLSLVFPDELGVFLDQMMAENSADASASTSHTPPCTALVVLPGAQTLSIPVANPTIPCNATYTAQLAKEIYDSVIIPHIHATCQSPHLVSFRIKFFHDQFMQPLTAFLADKCTQLPMSYSEQDALIVQALAALGIN